MATTASPQSADLRHYSRNLGPGVQERIFQATSDALRTQLDEHRDFLLQHQKQKQPQPQPQPHLTPVPVPVPTGPSPALTPSYTHPRPYTQPPQPASVLSTIPAAIVTRSPTKTVPGDINTYPLALREALYSHKSTSQAHDGRSIYHVVSSKASSSHSKDEAVVVASCRSMVAANEVAAQYFLDKYLDKGEDIKYKQLGNGALSCEAVVDKQRVSIHVQEARLERT